METDDLQRQIAECHIILSRIELRRNIVPWKPNAAVERLSARIRQMGERLDNILKRRKDRPGGLQ